MDEEKTIDEEKTVDEAVEEMTGEMKEFEPVAFDEAVKETEPERKDAPVLRALGDPEPADMNMIHKHLDNFLAKIAGETPIDENVRDSTEYWLNRIAESGGGGGGGTTVVANPEMAGTESALTGLQVGDTKYKVPAGNSLYVHQIRYDASNISTSIICSMDTAFSLSTLAQWLYNHNFNSSMNSYPTVAQLERDANKFDVYGGIYSSNGTSINGVKTRISLTTDGTTISTARSEVSYLLSTPALFKDTVTSLN